MTKNDVFKKSVSGGKWVTFSIVFQKVIGFLSFLVLARILSPEHYGSMAVATIAVGFLDVIFQPSFEMALSQKRETDKNMLNVVWTLNVLRGFLLGIIVYFVAPYIADFFKVPEDLNLIRATALFVVIRGFINIGQLFFFYDFDFRKVFILESSGQVFYIIVTLLVALTFEPSQWALYFGQLAVSICTVTASFALSHYRPRFSLDFAKIRKLLSYSKWIAGQNILAYLSNILDSVFLARLLSKESVGFYTKAKDLSIIPSSYLYQVLYKVGFAVYAKIQKSEDMVRSSFLKTFDIAAMISLPFLLVIFAYGFEIINFLFGAKWVAMVVPLQLLTLAMTFRSFIHAMYPVFDGIGRPKIRFNLMLVQFFVSLVTLFLLAPKYDLIGVAISVIIAYAVSFIIGISYILKVVKVKLINILPTFYVAVLPTLLCYFLVKMQKIYLPLDLYSSIAAAALLPLLYFATLIATGRLIGHDSYKIVLNVAKKAIGKN